MCGAGEDAQLVGCLPRLHSSGFNPHPVHKPGMLVYAYNPSTWEEEAGGSDTFRIILGSIGSWGPMSAM